MAEARYDANAQFNLIHEANVKRIEKEHQVELENISDWKEAKLKAIRESGASEAEQLAKIKELNQEIAKEQKDKEEQYLKNLEQAKKQSLKILEKFENKILSGKDQARKVQIRQARIDRLQELQTEYKLKKDQEELLADYSKELDAKIKAEKDLSIKASLQAELAAIEEKQKVVSAYLAENKEAYTSSASDIVKTKIDNAKDIGQYGTVEEIKQAAAELRKVAADQATNAVDVRNATQAAINLDNDARKKEAKEKNKAIITELKYRLTTLDGIKDTIEDGLLKMTSGLSKTFDSLDTHISSFYEYQAKYQARMEGSLNEYDRMLGNIGLTIGMSPFIKQTDMVKNLQTLIETGTNYNLELRAYIATVSEGIASTFEAFDKNLLRLVRIQQNDSTAARLGMEAALTRMLNEMYSDSSYLTDVSDSVTQALLDASAQLTHQGAAEMEFVAQKWLGSLYSLGVSGDAVQNIATGLGYLGSGNIEALSGNESLMSLMTMGAAKSGKSITEIMTGGLTAEKTNDLLYGITQYLQEIATNTDSNNVTKSAIAQIFGVTNTDLRSISNLSQNDFNTIYNSNLNYSQALSEASSQISSIAGRTHISQMISNILDNATMSSALIMGSNSGLYTTYKALNIVSNLVGDRGLEIPGIQALGTGTASGIDVLSVAKAAIAGGGLLASLIGAVGNLGNGGLPALSKWAGYEKALERGEGFKLNDYGIESGFSENVIYNNKGSGSIDDLSTAGMQESNERARENQNSKDQEVADDAATYYKEGLQRLNDMVNFINELETSAKSIPVRLVGVDNGTQLIIARLMKLGLFGDITTDVSGGFNLGNSMDNTDLFDTLKTKLNGLKVEVDNGDFDAIPVILRGGY